MTSTRFCVHCEKMRTFQYNKRIGHSECTSCGLRVALRYEPSYVKDNNIKELKQKIKEKDDIIGFYRRTVKQLSKRIKELEQQMHDDDLNHKEAMSYYD